MPRYYHFKAGFLFKQFRLKHKLTQEQLAKLMGVNSWTICMAERGHSQPHLRTQRKFEQIVEKYKRERNFWRKEARVMRGMNAGKNA